ncbi:MAG: hypothetical protein K9G49_15785 [Taibaiella sp.]|nr:hypothetical protein [Taibaiella sp.]
MFPLSAFRIVLIILVTLSALLLSCRKEKFKYASELEGTYNWTHNYSFSRAGVGNNTTSHPTVRFDIKKKNKKQIEVKGQILDLETMTDFEVTYGSGESMNTRYQLTYNKTTREIIFSASSHISAGANSYSWYSTFK